MCSIINGELWRPIKNLPYKHGVATYGGNMTDIIGVAAYCSCHKIRHAIIPWRQFDNTDLCP